jgi:hypothetical protein
MEVPEALCGVLIQVINWWLCMTTTDPTHLSGAILAQSAPGSQWWFQWTGADLCNKFSANFIVQFHYDV